MPACSEWYPAFWPFDWWQISWVWRGRKYTEGVYGGEADLAWP